jgi:hypothetical protein
MVFTLLCSSVMVLVVVFAVIVVIVVEKTLCKFWWYQFSLIWLLKDVLLLNQAISFRHVATVLFFNYLTFFLSDGSCNAIICQVQSSTGYMCMYQTKDNVQNNSSILQFIIYLKTISCHFWFI